MRKIEKSLLKIILLNDMLNSALLDLKPNQIVERDINERRLKLRLRNSLVSARMLSEISDEFFGKEELTTLFGDVADFMNEIFHAYMDNKLMISGKEFVNFPDGIDRNYFKEIFNAILSGELKFEKKK